MGSSDPLTSFFLGSYCYCRGDLPLGDGSQRGVKFVALGGADVVDDDEHIGGRGGAYWRQFWQRFPLQTPSAKAFCLSASVFSISAPPSFGNAQWTLFIVGFRSIRREPHENIRHRTLEAKIRPDGASWLLARATGAHSKTIDLLVSHFILFCYSQNFQTVLSDLALFRVP
jgi:hypothetical protein